MKGSLKNSRLILLTSFLLLSACQKVEVPSSKDDKAYTFIKFEDLGDEYKLNPGKTPLESDRFHQLVLKTNPHLKLKDKAKLSYLDSFGNTYEMQYWYPNQNATEQTNNDDWVTLVFGYQVRQENSGLSISDQADPTENPLCDIKICTGLKQYISVELPTLERGEPVGVKKIKATQYKRSGQFGVPNLPSGLLLDSNGKALLEVETENFVNFGVYQEYSFLREFLAHDDGPKLSRVFGFKSIYSATASLHDSEEEIKKGVYRCWETLNLVEPAERGIEGDFISRVYFSAGNQTLPNLAIEIQKIESDAPGCRTQLAENKFEFDQSQNKYRLLSEEKEGRISTITTESDSDAPLVDLINE